MPSMLPINHFSQKRVPPRRTESKHRVPGSWAAPGCRAVPRLLAKDSWGQTGGGGRGLHQYRSPLKSPNWLTARQTQSDRDSQTEGLKTLQARDGAACARARSATRNGGSDPCPADPLKKSCPFPPLLWSPNTHKYHQNDQNSGLSLESPAWNDREK